MAKDDVGEPSSPSKATQKQTPEEKNKDHAVPAPRSSSSALFVVLPIIVAAIGALWVSYTSPASLDGLPLRHLIANESTESSVPSMDFPTKYESEIVHMETTKFLLPSDAQCPVFDVQGDVVHVEDAMTQTSEALAAKNLVFLMLNGQNEGLYFSWTPSTECLYELAMAAATALGSDVDLLPNGVTLRTQMGQQITSVEQLHENRVAHVLLDGQIWVWPGIKVGHVMDVEGWTVKTLSLHPKVFGVEGFFTEDEANSIIEQGVAHLARSPVDSPDAVDGYHSDRTSDTAFLDDNAFTRNFRVRTAKLTRLPSPSFVERLQLVRYKTGQFFRKHEDYFDSKQFLDKKAVSHEDYETWTKWAAKQIDALPVESELPADFRAGGSMYPNFEDKAAFQHALLGSFQEDAEATDFFMEHADLEWGEWIRSNLETGANDIMNPLLASKGYMLRHIINSWEKRAGLRALKYTIPKRKLSAVTQYFRWIRWAKERVQDLMDEDLELVPLDFRPNGKYYPTYHVAYQNDVLGFVLDDASRTEFIDEFGEEWTEWLYTNADVKDVLLEALRSSDVLFEKIVQAFVKRAGERFQYTIPTHLHHFQPNRFVTVFLYLNECPEGGETVFPYSRERLVTGIEREGMNECSKGLAVPPRKLTASMFYSQTPENDVDPSSMHGGCPPAHGIKYGSNSFAWNADADEGANTWDLGADLKMHPEN